MSEVCRFAKRTIRQPAIYLTRAARILALFFSAITIAACSQLPTSGPAHRDILNGAATALVNEPYPNNFEYALVELSPNVVEHAIDIDPGSFFRSYGKGKGPAPEILVGRGDIIQLTVFESKSGGLFIPADSGTRPGNFVQLPPQTVDHDGYIIVPYAGKVLAAGQTLPAIQTLSITHKSLDSRGSLGNKILESVESFVIPYRAPDSQRRGAFCGRHAISRTASRAVASIGLMVRSMKPPSKMHGWGGDLAI